jgi:hypothetical protein
MRAGRRAACALSHIAGTIMVGIVGQRNYLHELLLAVGVEVFAPINDAVLWG